MKRNWIKWGLIGGIISLVIFVFIQQCFVFSTCFLKAILSSVAVGAIVAFLAVVVEKLEGEIKGTKPSKKRKR